MRSLRYGYWWLAGGLLLVAFVLYKTLSPPGGGSGLMNDKLAHFLAFAALMVWFSGLVPTRRYPYLFLALLAYGAVIEGLQYFTGYRAMDPEDLVADAIGLIVGWGLALLGLGDWCHRLELRFRKS